MALKLLGRVGLRSLLLLVIQWSCKLHDPFSARKDTWLCAGNAALCIQPSVLEDLEVCELPTGCLQEAVYPVYGMRCYEADLSDLSDLGLK